MENETQLTRKERLKLKAIESKNRFSKEFQKSASTAIIAAFGFLIALVWRDAITEYVNKISAISPIQGKLISAFFVTIVSVIGIIIVTKIFSVEK